LATLGGGARESGALLATLLIALNPLFVISALLWARLSPATFSPVQAP